MLTIVDTTLIAGMWTIPLPLETKTVGAIVSITSGIGSILTGYGELRGEYLHYPEAGPVILGAVHRRLVRRFPYGILYSIKPDGVRILAVMNLKRRPAYWIGRK